MSPRRPAVSLVAERALRLLRGRPAPTDSLSLLREVLATRAGDEAAATRILETAFAGDPRLLYGNGGWSCAAPPPAAVPGLAGAAEGEPDRVLVLLRGARPAPRLPWEAREVAGVRLRGDSVVSACGGQPLPGPEGEALRQEFLEIFENAVAVMHDPPGARATLERWLDEPVANAISVRRLATQRLDLPAHHDLERLAARLGLEWRASEELLDQSEILDACLRALAREGETLEDLRAASSSGAPAVPWSRYDFDRGFLRAIPRTAGTYRFYDREDRLLYVGKAKDLHRRVGSYFRESGRRPDRVQRLLDELHRIEVEPLHSDLEAMLQEAVEIARREPSRNVQRHVHLQGHHRSRMMSIMILEPAAPPLVLRAYLLHDGRFLDRVGIGRRGGGLRRIRRLLQDHFFSIPDGPTPAPGSDVDLELVARWLAANRDRVVAFDPTSLRSTEEVLLRLRELLGGGVLRDPDGAPIRPR